MRLELLNYISIFLIIFAFFLKYKNYLQFFTLKDYAFTFFKILNVSVFCHFLLIHINPFSYFILIWFPFKNLIKIFLIFLISIKFLNSKFNYEINNYINTRLKEILREKENSNDNNNYYHISNERLNLIDKFNNKIFAISLVLFLVSIKSIMFIVDDKFSHLLINKQDIIKEQKFFIAANLYNNEEIIEDWILEVKKLISFLGQENVFVSISENGDSTDKTKEYLETFKDYLSTNNILNEIVTKKIVEKEGKERIEFLSLIRNEAIKPIHNLNWNLDKTKIIFLNDIIFTFTDIIKLINSNSQNYDQICGLDFYLNFYDRWASYGIDGKSLKGGFPYFPSNSGRVRVVNGELIRVFGCWNGVIVMTAEPFNDINLKFRAGKNLFKSECTFLTAEYWIRGHTKILINPNLKFSYTYIYYYLNKYFFPYTKDVLTYFYYYFGYFFVEDCENFGNLDTKEMHLPPGITNSIIFLLMN